MRTVKVLSLAAVFGLAACGPKVAKIDLDPATIDFAKKGETKTVVATPKDAEGKKVENVQLKWASSDPKVATVDATGKVTAVDSGEAKITATFETFTGTATVKASIPASISFSPAEVKLEGVGAKAAVQATVRDGKGVEMKLPVTWTSDDVKVATVANGEVTAVAAGTTKIQAAVGDLKAPVAVTVVVPVVAAVEADKAVEIAKAGETVKLNAAAKDAEGKAIASAPLTFASADEKIATVDATGTVTGVAKGKTKVTVTSGDKSATVEVKVKK